MTGDQKAIMLVFFSMLACSMGGLFAAEENMSESKDKIAEAISWLETEAHRIIRASKRDMKDGTAAFPPQLGIGHEAFWLRDYEYALEGSIASFSDKELTDACRLFLRSLDAEGAGVDCVKFDGTPVYKPGYGSMGENPVADFKKHGACEWSFGETRTLPNDLASAALPLDGIRAMLERRQSAKC